MSKENLDYVEVKQTDDNDDVVIVENANGSIRLSNIASKPLLSSSKKSNNVGDSNSNGFLYRIRQLLDFNLKFKNSKLEQVFNHAYSSIMRFIFLQYLIYLLLFLIVWIIYFSVDEFRPSSSTFLSNFTLDNLTITNFNDKTHSAIIIYYMLLLVALIIAMLVVVLFIEIKETEYKWLERRQKQKEIGTRVSIAKAEQDLKEAMHDVMIKEKELFALKEKLESKYVKVHRLRILYQRIEVPCSVLIITGKFNVCLCEFLLKINFLI
jgi:hypothetical protein